MKKPLFSIIITAFNQESKIEKTINSVLCQSCSDFEIVIVDDASTDNTFKLIKALQKKNDKIRIIRHEENKSSFQSRISGIKNARGQYLLFLDGDDLLIENSLQELKDQVIQKEDFEVCEFSYLQMSNNSKVISHNIAPALSFLEAFAMPDMPATLVWNKLYNTQFIKKAFSKIPAAYMNVAEDWYMNICIGINLKKYIQKDITVYCYNDFEGITNIKYSFEKNEKNFKSIQKVLECTASLLKSTNNVELAEKIISNFQCKLYDWAKVKIKYQTAQADVLKSYLLLSKYFPAECLENDFKLLFEDALKFRRGYFSLKNFLRRLYHFLKGRGLRNNG